MPAFLSSAPATTHGALVPIGKYIADGTSGYVLAFSNIPQGYQDLFLVGYSRTSAASSLGFPYLRLNDDTSSLYSDTYLTGNGSTASSARNTTQTVSRIGVEAGGSSTSGIFGSLEVHILNYANTSTFKTVLSRSAADLNGSGESRMVVSLYRSTNAISSIRISDEIGGNFVSGSVWCLYGVRTVNQ